MNVWLLHDQHAEKSSLQFTDERAILKTNECECTVQVFGAVVTGGTYRDYLKRILKTPNAALLIEPCCHLFDLPCRDGCGEACTFAADEIWQFSPELCSEWTIVNRNRFFLRDTRETLIKKIECAQKANISIILLTDIAHKMITASSM